MKRRGLKVLVAVVLIVITIILSIENRPQTVISSSVYQNTEQTEIHLYVLMNTLFGVDRDEISEVIISEHQKVNGVQNKTIYTLRLYRTLFHYRWNWDYDTIICDANGAIICCGEDLGV